MQSLAKKNFSSAVQVLFQQAVGFISAFLVTALTVRNIPRSEYGQMALVLSYGVIFNLFNMAVSSVLLRDYPKLTREQVVEHMSSFYTFNMYKSVFVILVTVLIGYYLNYRYKDPLLLEILAINTGMMICQNYTEPLQVFFSVAFKQNLVTQIVFMTTLVNVLATFGVLIWPHVLFVVIKNLMIALLALVLFNYYFFRNYDFRIEYFSNKHLGLLIKNLGSFSVWSHLQGVFTDVIYRADILILGWLNTPFQTMGNYNIALQLANMTKIVPQIVQYHTTLSVGNISNKENRDEAVHIYTKANFVISLCIMAGYVLFGKMLISVIAKTQSEEIFRYGLYILGGLSLINLFRSLVAYSIVSHSIKQVALLVNLPAAVFAVAAYSIGGIYWGVQGVLVANVLIAIVLSALIVVYINKKTDYKWSYSLITDYEMTLLKKLWAKMMRKQPIP